MSRDPRAYGVSRVWDVSASPTGGEVIRTAAPRPADVELALPLEEDVGELRRYRLHFPFLPLSKNKYDAWPGEYKTSHKAKWRRAVAGECERLQIPKGQVKIGLSAVLWFATNNRRDPQNYASQLWHHVPDALQRCGVLVDDRDGAIDFGPRLGVEIRVDTRPIAKTHKERTVVGLVVRAR